MKILLWVHHHNRSIGHWVRTAAIARQLYKKHSVCVLAGGHTSALCVLPDELKVIELPLILEHRITVDYTGRDKKAENYVAADGRDIRTVLCERAQIVKQTVTNFTPDVLITEYFPLDRYLLEEELIGAIQTVKEYGGIVVSSVRDILQGDLKKIDPNTSQAPGFSHRIAYHEYGLNMLNNYYDHLLVHGDENLFTLEQTVSEWFLQRIRVPVTYTGYVSQPLPALEEMPDEVRKLVTQGGFVVVSIGGGGLQDSDPFRPGADLILRAIHAWRLLAERGCIANRHMVLFTGENISEQDLQKVRKACADGPFIVHRARADFLHWLRAADLSISRAGYNTCANLLATQIPAILVSASDKYDQNARAQSFAEYGLVSASFVEEEITPELLATAIEKGLTHIPGDHNIALDGAQQTAAIIEKLHYFAQKQNSLENRKNGEKSEKMKILLWEHHFGPGTGHFIRIAEIARALCNNHSVYLLAGGRAMTLSALPAEVELIQLPVVEQQDISLGYSKREENTDYYVAADGRDIARVLNERTQIVADIAAKIAPDVFISEYFPFARVPLMPELMAAIQPLKARGGLVLSSVRGILQGDLKAKIRNDRQNMRLAQRIAFHKRTINILNNHFDALLVHSDERFIALEKTVPEWMLKNIRVPVVYTGYISQPLPDAETRPREIDDLLTQGGFVVVSVGGGGARSADSFKPGAAVVYSAIKAWWLLAERGRIANRRMVLFIAEKSSDEDLQQVQEACADGPFIIRRATLDFLYWLQAADLSISRAGYNTSVNVLATQVPAILLPDRMLNDQEFRAREFADHGLATAVLFEQELTSESLAAAIEQGLTQAPARHNVSLDGAQRTGAIIEKLHYSAQT